MAKRKSGGKSVASSRKQTGPPASENLSGLMPYCYYVSSSNLQNGIIRTTINRFIQTVSLNFSDIDQDSKVRLMNRNHCNFLARKNDSKAIVALIVVKRVDYSLFQESIRRILTDAGDRPIVFADMRVETVSDVAVGKKIIDLSQAAGQLGQISFTDEDNCTQAQLMRRVDSLLGISTVSSSSSIPISSPSSTSGGCQTVARGLTPLQLSPHCMEAPSCSNNGLYAFLLCHNVSHGRLLFQDKTLMLLYTICRIQLRMSIESNRRIYGVHATTNPFGIFHRAGVNVCFSSDDQMILSRELQGMIQEQVLITSAFDLSFSCVAEIRRRSVMSSPWSMDYVNKPQYETAVPPIRLIHRQLRYDNLIDKLLRPRST